MKQLSDYLWMSPTRFFKLYRHELCRILKGCSTPIGSAGSLFYLNAEGQYTEIQAGTEGQVLKMVSGVPTWV